jgi:polyhydroxyalkanoate synthesis regulator phasin
MVKTRSLASLREWVEQSRQRLDEWQRQVDGKIRSTIDNISQSISPWASINRDVQSLADRIEELEGKLRLLEAHDQAAEAARDDAAPAAEPPATPA